ncbi:MAG: hypothetical protein M3T49_03005 [Candidatus Eremiobacteraeota bacterium]|nr:hypothetical protein [Candidatus Eremiobacteraeota bacterium]
MKFAVLIGVLVGACVALGTLSADAARMLSVGQSAPDIKGQSIVDGRTVDFDLRAAASRRSVVLYFFPKAFTAG